MSGIEVLGIILGAIPLLISACEHFRDTCTARDMVFHFEACYGRVLANIKDEELFLRLHLKKLLLPLVEQGSDDLDTLLFDPGGSRWLSRDVDDMLRTRLADGHDRYMEIVEAVQTILHKLLISLRYKLNPFQERLEVLKAANASDDSSLKLKLQLKANMRLLARQINFVIMKWNRDALVEELHDNIEKLEKILNSNSEIALIQERSIIPITGRAVQSLLQQWRHASRVYDVIFKSCPCRQSHCAHLWLQHLESPAFELRLLVFFSPPNMSPLSCPWQQQGLRIQSLDQVAESNDPSQINETSEASASFKTDQCVGSNDPQLMTSRPPAIQDIGRRDGKRPVKGKLSVRFSLKPSNTRDRACDLTSNMASIRPGAKKARLTPLSTPDTHAIQDISNLCTALAECGMKSVTIGALTAREDAQSYRYKVSSQPEQKIVAAGEISLHEILQPAHRPRLRRGERIRIALKIASSHLKLHSTPWARRQWESRNIKFPYTADGRGSKSESQSGASSGTHGGSRNRHILIDRPFIDANFVEESLPPSEHAAGDPSTKSFVCLGIMLLELFFGKPLEEHELWSVFSLSEGKSGSEVTAGGSSGASSRNSRFRLMVAGDWARELDEQEGPEVAGVVKWCLNESPMTLRDEKWRRDLADRVVLPLQRIYEWAQSSGVP